ncbi:hypothetical protein [Salinisphaera sp. Q1T1-3]|uniref:hypothetical protein n=1 Tax=Salinisphaera sp. Q1T1-3 TaxID=2321229 RepID=UPI000E74F684|nr:hypothetical protein [Salinisphaera sp. Q1T1-3]RJS92031.1 hypothetical protein D3260_12855 [Salinisphaera sp. Q1T1-3]
MGEEYVSTFIEYSLFLLKILGATSLLGLMGFVTAYYALPPNLAIAEIKDKGQFNFESRLQVENIGRLPAFRVIADVERMNFVMGGMNMSNMAATDCGIPTAKLAAGERMELPACPHVGVPPGSNLSSCDYVLKLKYEFRLPFFSKKICKRWDVELRNAGQEFTWQIALR